MGGVFVHSGIEKNLGEMNYFLFVLFENESNGIGAARPIQTSKEALGVEQIIFWVRQFLADRNYHFLEFCEQQGRYLMHLEELLQNRLQPCARRMAALCNVVMQAVDCVFSCTVYGLLYHERPGRIATVDLGHASGLDIHFY